MTLLFTAEEIKEALGLQSSIEELTECLRCTSSYKRRCIMSAVIPFGKYKGKTVKEIFDAGDYGYLKFLVLGAKADDGSNWVKEKFTDVYDESVRLLESCDNK